VDVARDSLPLMRGSDFGACASGAGGAAGELLGLDEAEHVQG
jgi:hypothetical protein